MGPAKPIRGVAMSDWESQQRSTLDQNEAASVDVVRSIFQTCHAFHPGPRSRACVGYNVAHHRVLLLPGNEENWKVFPFFGCLEIG